jgi:hypothetical protein
MNWLTRVAIFFGRKKFEEFAQANPQLPDDALAVANTLDTYPVRGAVTLIAGSLAHAADNVLRGTETAEQLATHALLVLAGLCIIWVRHAISKHDVTVSDVVQKARDTAGIQRVVNAIMIVFGLTWFVVGPLPSAGAQTNAATIGGSAGLHLAEVASATQAGASPSPLLTQLASNVTASAKFSSGVGINLHAKVAPLLSQELSLFGETGTNTAWSTGPSHATFFLPEINEEQLGWSVSGSWKSPPRILRLALFNWKSPPRILRLALFNARDIEWTVNWGLPAEDVYRLFRHVDWRENRFGVSVTRKF